MRVLIVEDNPTTQDALLAVLARAGHEAEYAGDGYGALTRLHVHVPDAVVADYRLPGLDGWQLLRAMRANPAWRDVPFVLATAVAEQDLPPLGPDDGPVRLIRKPFDPAELLALLESPAGKDREASE